MFGKGRKNGTVRFAVKPRRGVKKVMLAGDFSGWRPVTMRKQKQGDYVAVVPLDAGSYEYKFIFDGQWAIDPDNSMWASNSFGSVNSVALVD